jgi:hypothetical protein
MPPTRASGAVQTATGPKDPGDYPGYCARPSCRKEFRRVAATGRPGRFCSDNCRRVAQTEQRAAEAKVRHMEANLRQARGDLADFFTGDMEGSHGDAQHNAEVALAQPGAALRYISDSEVPGILELRALYEAVKPLIAPTHESLSVA